MNGLRNIFFQIHLWVGLGLGLLFIALGLSGSLLVYPGLMARVGSGAPAATSPGAQLPLEQIIAAARATSPRNATAAATLTLPQEGEAAGVRFAAGRGAGRGPGQDFGRREGGNGGRDAARGGRRGGARGDFAGRGGANAPQIFIDPVSGKVLASITAQPSRLVGMAHQIHESMMLGRSGRMVLGGLGVFMFFLGLSGLYLWWPKAGQWKYAFIVRPSARGARLYREIHGAFGIWFLVVFLVVTATGIPLAFPGLGGGGRPSGGGPPPAAFAQRQGANAPQAIDVPADAKMLPLAALVAAAEKSAGLKAASLTVPTRQDRPVTVTMAQDDEEGPPLTIAVNPYSGEAAVRTAVARPPRRQGLSVRGLHAGQGLGPVYRALVFASGFLPLLFAVTGFLMWLKKRQARRRPA